MKPKPPQTDAELLARARNLAGQSLANLTQHAQLDMPKDYSSNKGWTGQLLEWHLGTTASTKAEPDFVELGIELKTIPIHKNGQPKESTYVCIVPLTQLSGLSWQSSLVWHKLRRVLWIPLQADPDIALADRCVGNPLLWSPNQFQAEQLKQDWEEHIEMISLGQIENITAKQGNSLQIRPKGASAKDLTDAIGPNGSMIRTLPRGFYLRPEFTAQIMQQYYF